jgi:predicted transcriptional regulator
MLQTIQEQPTKRKRSVRLNRQIIEDFLNLQKKLPQVIQLYGLQHSNIYKAAGISRATYYRKLKTYSFDGEEMLRICDAINK